MRKRTIKPRFKFLLLAVFLAYAAFAIYGQQVKINELKTEQEALTQSIEQAETDYSRLEHKSEYMNTSEYVENTAREKFGLAYEDELIIETEDAE
jgi:cell division protein FtsL